MDRPQSDKRYHLTSWQTLRKQNNSLGIRSARLNLTSGKRDLPKKIALTHFFFKLKYNWFILLCKFQVHTAKEFYIYVYIHIHIHTHIYVCVYAHLCLTLCSPMDCSPSGSSVHEISQARILEWVAISLHSLLYIYICIYRERHTHTYIHILIYSKILSISNCKILNIVLWAI